jgi:hypothetical protein
MNTSKLSPSFLKELNIVHEALIERSEHDVLNAPTKRKNKKIKKMNFGLGPKDKTRIPLKRLPHPYPKELKSVFQRETIGRIDRSKRTWDEWVQLIDYIEDRKIRNRVGCLVWWEQVGEEVGGKNVTCFDKYLNARADDAVEPEDIAMALYKIGYTPYSAWNLSKPPVIANVSEYREYASPTLRPDWIGGQAGIAKTWKEDNG